jgi:hypothetical protein
VRNEYFLLSDFVTSGSAKNYTFQLHGNGLYGSSPSDLTGAFIPDFSNSRGMYSRNSVSLLANVTTPGNASGYSWETDSMVIAGGFRRYSKMLVQKNAVTGTVFLSTLFPYTTAIPQVLPAGQNNSVVSSRIQTNNYRDLVFCSQDADLHIISADSSGLNKQVKGNGNVNFLSETSDGHFASAFLQYGDSIISGLQTLIQTDRKMDVAWMKMDSVLSGGYISDSGTVKFYSRIPLQMVRGPVSTHAYDSLHYVMVVAFGGKGNFIFGPADLTWVWTGQQDEDWHNPANWQMQDHPVISGIPLATNNVIISSGAPNMPVVSSTDPATCHDLTIRRDASLTVGSLKFLTVEGTITLEE